MELTLADFVLIVIFGSAFLVLVFTMFSRTLHARREARSLKDRVICRLCLHAFEDHAQAKIVNCPRCGAANQKGSNRQLG
jgi:hypothetical protein